MGPMLQSSCWGFLCAPAAEALNAMGRLSRCPVADEDRLLVSENAASNFLSLAAQIALEVTLITLLCAPVAKCVALQKTLLEQYFQS